MARGRALRAVVVECERNPAPVVRALAARVAAAVAEAPGLRGPPGERAELPSVASGAVLAEAGVDHRRAQRVLFRMALDPGFAADVFAGRAPTGLAAPADGWVRGVDPALLAADPGGRRRDQLLGNVALEFVHTVRAWPGVLAGFPGSAAFHAAIAEDRPLPLAFAAHAAEVVPPGPARALLRLDAALAEARRVDRPVPAGTTALAPGARLVTLPAGTLAAAEAVAAGRPAPAPDAGAEELVAIGAVGPPGPEREVRVELVADGIAALLAALPLDEAGLAAFAAAHELAGEALEEVLAGLRADGFVAAATGERPAGGG
ncbi:MAG: hypothetical protein R3F59_23555 [Myxococcota bacterium]